MPYRLPALTILHPGRFIDAPWSFPWTGPYTGISGEGKHCTSDHYSRRKKLSTTQDCRGQVAQLIQRGKCRLILWLAGIIQRDRGFTREVEASRSISPTHCPWRSVFPWLVVSISFTYNILFPGSKYERNLPSPILDRKLYNKSTAEIAALTFHSSCKDGFVSYWGFHGDEGRSLQCEVTISGRIEELYIAQEIRQGFQTRPQRIWTHLSLVIFV